MSVSFIQEYTASSLSAVDAIAQQSHAVKPPSFGSVHLIVLVPASAANWLTAVQPWKATTASPDVSLVVTSPNDGETPEDWATICERKSLTLARSAFLTSSGFRPRMCVLIAHAPVGSSTTATLPLNLGSSRS